MLLQRSRRRSIPSVESQNKIWLSSDEGAARIYAMESDDPRSGTLETCRCSLAARCVPNESFAAPFSQVTGWAFLANFTSFLHVA